MVAGPQRHSNELADDALFHAVSINPRLLRDNYIVLWFRVDSVSYRGRGLTTKARRLGAAYASLVS